MGKAIQAAIAGDPGFELANDHGQVLIDFSAPGALRSSLDRAISAGVPLLIGTTGLIEEHEALIAEAAKTIPILRAPNTSLGVALLADLTERAARVLGPGQWDIEIVEAHHNKKADAPSGTALLLGEAAKRGRGEATDERGRDGVGLKREPGTIGYAAIRGGTVPGDHDVMFLGPEERLILSHRAESRMIFARGALAGARFLKGKPAGLYSMADVIDAS
jgi:4-hydroxy-tetrahydrodipicolinate reductase